MPHFVYDSTALNFPKTNLNVLPVGANPAQYIQAEEDWNPAMQAAYDLRDSLKNGKYFGFQAQASDPLPSGVTNYVYLTSTGVLTVKYGVTTYSVVPSTRQVIAGTGLDGGGALSTDVTLSLEPIVPNPAGTFSQATVTVDQYGRVTAASSGGGSGMAIGGSIANSPTTGSLLFVGAGGVLQQDNANLFWDDSTDRLGIGTASPQTPLDARNAASNAYVARVTSTSASGYSAIEYYNSSSTFQSGLGFGNASVALTHLANRNYWYSGSSNIVFANAAKNNFVFGTSDGDAFIEMDAGAGAVVSSSGTGRIRYNQSTNTFQVSVNGAAYVDITTGSSFSLDIGDSIGSSTVGSLLFVGSGGTLQQDNANFFWDDTNNRLGIGTAVPGRTLDVRGNVTGTHLLDLRNTHASGYVGIGFFDEGGTERIGFGYSNVDDRSYLTLTSNHFHWSSGASFRGTIFHTGEFNIGPTTTAPSTLFRVEGSAQATSLALTTFLEMANGSAAAVSSSNTGRIRYNTTGQKFQVSSNAGAYNDLLPLSGTTTPTSGSVFFAASTGFIAEDNSNFFWDNTNNRLGLGTNVPDSTLRITSATTHALRIQGTNSAGHSSLSFHDHSDVSQIAFGWGNTSVTDTSRTGKAYWGTNNQDLVFIRAFGSPSTVAMFIQGSTGFVGVGTGIEAPGAAFHVRADNAPVGLIERSTTGLNTWLNTLWVRATTTGDMVDGFGPNLLFQIKDSANVNNSIGHLSFVRAGADSTGDFVVFPNTAGSPNERFRVSSAGLVSVVGSTGAFQLPDSTAAVSAASTARLRYDAAAGALQVSLNAGAYADLITSATSVPTSRTLTAGAGLTGGGDLSANRTFDVGAGNGIEVNTDSVGVNMAYSGFTWTSAHTWQKDAVGNFPTTALNLTNTTAAALNAQQRSPAVLMRGSGWETTGSTSQAVEYIMQVLPIQGTTAPTGALLWSTQINGTGGFVERMRLTSGGVLTVGDLISSPRSELDDGNDSVLSYMAALLTSNATTTTLSTIAIPANRVVAIEISVIAHNEDMVQRAMFTKKALIYDQSGVTAIQGSVQSMHADVETSAGLDATIDVSGNNARVRVTGLGETITWHAKITVQRLESPLF